MATSAAARPPHAIAIVDFGFGDSGKGSIVDFLTRHCAAHTVVRFNGGPQAGHTVVTIDGKWHTFAQFGSGSFVPGTQTLLSRFMLIEPYAMLNEAEHLRSIGVEDALDRSLIDRRCIVITPPQQAANRLRELARGDRMHGTCGMGVGEATQDSIEHPEHILRAEHLRDVATVTRKLHAHRDHKLEQLRDLIKPLRRHPLAEQCVETLLDASWIPIAVDNYRWLADHVTVVNDETAAACLRAEGTMIFEGAQGVLLDESFGFYPHTTWSNTTFDNVHTLLAEAGADCQVTRLGVLRCYATRHGAGPFVTEDAALSPYLPEPHNHDCGWQDRFRVGHFDAVAARYALAVAGQVDGLALSHLDRCAALRGRVCTEYLAEADERDLAEWLESQGSFVRNIKVRRPADLSRQQRLSELLSACRPHFAQLLSDRPEHLVACIERELALRVVIESHGPVANDKHLKWRDRFPGL